MQPLENRMRAALKDVFGYDDFRPGQYEIARRLLEGGDALAVMPTGAGKSICYQLPALLLPGVTVVVSPLISLMRDQVQALVQMGVRAAYINSSLTEAQCRKALDTAARGVYKIVYAAPERLLTPGFAHFARSAQISLVCVDEAHCVSQWGQDFRPSYQRIPEFMAQLPARVPMGAFTATATARVKDDIRAMLGLVSPLEITTGFDRPNLFFEVQHLANKEKPLALRLYLASHTDASGIVYCSTRKQVDEVYAGLRAEGYAAARYHAGMPAEERAQSQEDFLYDRARVMVATNAFGMGIDKSNVSYVIHYNMPLDVESYYQEAGRAGRDGQPADCILFYAPGDVRTNRFLIEHSAPAEEVDEALAAQLRAGQEERLRRMTFYCHSKYCLRAELLRYFGERAPKECGHCSVCAPHAQRASLTHALASRAKKQSEAQAKAVDAGLLERLKEVRLAFAKREGVPAFVVFSDAALRDMCAKLPVTPAAFLQVSGVGAKKCERYGEAFMRVIREYTQAQ